MGLLIVALRLFMLMKTQAHAEVNRKLSRQINRVSFLQSFSLKACYLKERLKAVEWRPIFSCRLATISDILCVVSAFVLLQFLQLGASALAFQGVLDGSLIIRSFGMRNVLWRMNSAFRLRIQGRTACCFFRLPLCGMDKRVNSIRNIFW